MDTYLIGFNMLGVEPGRYSETVEGDRFEAARMLLDSYSNNFSYGPEIFRAIVEWLDEASLHQDFEFEPAPGFVYYIELLGLPKS